MYECIYIYVHIHIEKNTLHIFSYEMTVFTALEPPKRTLPLGTCDMRRPVRSARPKNGPATGPSICPWPKKDGPSEKNRNKKTDHYIYIYIYVYIYICDDMCILVNYNKLTVLPHWESWC